MIPTAKKTRVAFVKFGGMAAGGTEKYLQIIAAQLPKDRFEVDYYYCDAAPYIGSDWKHPDTDASRLDFMEGTGVNLIKFNVGFKDVTIPTHDWKNTDFWEVFDEAKYDIVQTGRAGHPEYPFTRLEQVAIVDSIHLSGMVDNQENIARVIHISEQNAQAWIKAGGIAGKVDVIYPPVITPGAKKKNFRKELGIGPDDFVYGLHQRDNEEIFSPVPIAAFAEIQKRNTNRKVHFVLLGGSKQHREQGEKLENFHVLPFTGDIDRVWSFLATLDVYTHGRKDGEVNSQAIAEAMFCGLPIVSHLGNNNGHIETIGNAGQVHKDINSYLADCVEYCENDDYRAKRSQMASEQFAKKYDLDTNIGRIVKIYDSIMRNKTLDNIPDEDFWDSVWEDEEK